MRFFCTASRKRLFLLKVLLLDKLEEVAEVSIGQPMLFTWVEAVREFLEDRKRSQEKDVLTRNSRIGMAEVDFKKLLQDRFNYQFLLKVP